MTEERLLDEFSKLNNELVNARRELQRVNAALAEKERFLAKVLDMTPFAVYVFNLASGRNEYSSRDVASLLGYSAAEITAMGANFLPLLMHPEDLERFGQQRAVIDAAADGQSVVFDYRMRDKAGAWRWLRSTDAVFSRNEAGLPERVVGIAEDINREKLREEILEEASYVDQLTGLRNRRSFDELAEHQARIAARNGAPFAIAFFDMDRFKAINDVYGHAEGDEALKSAAAILTDVFRSGDVVARFGGDEFIALLPDTGAAALPPLLARLRTAAEAFNAGSGKPWRLEFSIGTAQFDPSAGESLESLIARADVDMYVHKKARRAAEGA